MTAHEDGRLAPAIDRLFVDWAVRGRPGGGVAIVKGERVVHSRCYGLANVETGDAFRPDHRFAIASVTKQFTAYAILLLEEKGRISIDDVLQEKFPDFVSVAAPITIRQLLNNTSGLRDHITLATFAGGRLLHGDKDALRALITAQAGLNFDPGARYCYSNTNFVLLSWVIERITGKSLGEALYDLIFEPLQMNSTSVVENPLRPPKFAAAGYAGTGAVGFRPWNWDMSVAGDGGMWSTLGDLIKWELNFANPRCGSRAIQERMRERPVFVDGTHSAYALGLTTGSISGQPWEGHGGGFDGYRSFRLRFPTLDLGIIALANFTADIQRAAEEVASLFLPFQWPVSNFEGVYRSRELNTSYAARVQDGQLLLSVAGPLGLLSDLPLVRRSDDTFAPARSTRLHWDLEFDTTFRFDPPRDGRSPRMTMGCEWAAGNVCERQS